MRQNLAEKNIQHKNAILLAATGWRYVPTEQQWRRHSLQTQQWWLEAERRYTHLPMVSIWGIERLNETLRERKRKRKKREREGRQRRVTEDIAREKERGEKRGGMKGKRER